MQSDIDRVLIDRKAIARRVEALARRITRDFCTPANRSGAIPSVGHEHSPSWQSEEIGHDHSEAITLVPILTGSMIFVADLIRHLPLYLKIRLLSISAYPGRTTSSRGARVERALTDLPESLAGAHVLLIDDILDSGRTLRLARGVLQSKDPQLLRTCVLLRKRRPQAMAVEVDYVCFDIPDAFVVGYGLDYDDYYRNLPDLVTLRREVLDA